jgi:hypothetical protein
MIPEVVRRHTARPISEGRASARLRASLKASLQEPCGLQAPR